MLIKNNIRPAYISMNSFTIAEIKFVSHQSVNFCLDTLKRNKEEADLIAYKF